MSRLHGTSAFRPMPFCICRSFGSCIGPNPVVPSSHQSDRAHNGRGPGGRQRGRSAADVRCASDKGEAMSTPAVSRQRVVTRPSHAVPTPRPPVAVPRPAPESGPPPERITGRYRYDRRSGTWWWSPEMFVLHGLPITSAHPATEEYLRYQHADDRPRVLEAITRACTDGCAFTLETRIVRADGRDR